MPEQLLPRAGHWAMLAFPLHLLWEVAHVRLYEIWATGTASTIIWDVLHCTIGDVLIALAAFFLTSTVFKDSNWPASRPVPGGLLFVFSALVYTAWSEWRNVYLAESWQLVRHAVGCGHRDFTIAAMGDRFTADDLGLSGDFEMALWSTNRKVMRPQPLHEHW